MRREQTLVKSSGFELEKGFEIANFGRPKTSEVGYFATFSHLNVQKENDGRWQTRKCTKKHKYFVWCERNINTLIEF